MKLVISFLASFLISIICLAQGSDPSAKKILDQASAKIKSYKSIQAVFTLQLQDAQGASQGTKKGNVNMKGSKYVVFITGQEIYCDGKTVWDYIKDANEVQIKDMETGGDDAVNPSTIFTIYEN